jgi:alpha-acetolactate decarboxylase
MVASIPNDIFQFSTYTAVTRGFNTGQPRTADLTSHGTDGIGIFEDGTLMLLTNSVTYNLKDGHAKPALMHARLSFAMVTIFYPGHKLDTRGLSIDTLDSQLSSSNLGHIWGANSLMPFRIEGNFTSIEIDGGSEHRDVKAAIFGFVVPSWMEGISGPRTHCHCVMEETDRKERFGGKVKRFETRRATLGFAKCGRFHLGFPQGEEWETQELA